MTPTPLPERQWLRVANRGNIPSDKAHPGLAKDDCDGQVSWLTAQTLDPRLPRPKPSGVMGIVLAADSCGGSPGLTPGSHLIPLRGTRYEERL